MDLWVCILLVLVGFATIFIEFFVPAGGLVGLAGVGSMVVGIVFAYSDHGTVAGTIVLVVALVGTPATLIIGFKIFPRTFMGRRLILTETQQQDAGYSASTSEKYTGLLGSEGSVVSPLRPAGMVTIANQKYSVVTEGDMVEIGACVKVIAVEGSRIVVQRLASPEQTTA